jgi:3'(2'), 5'-bisphosphate nucleotidase
MSDLGGAFAHELAVAEEVALEAARVVRRFHGTTFTIDSKAGNEPVTEADHAANEIIVKRLRAAFPRDAILSEEIPDDGARIGHARVWMVDPIDGTSDFIRGDGRPRVGAVAHPLSDRIYSGVVGEGASRREADGTRTPLSTSTLAGPPGIRLVASKSHRTGSVDAVKKALGIVDELNVGSVGLKIGLVSEAARDLYVYTGGRTKIWDSAGPEAILHAAGGRMTDLDGDPLVYDQPDLYNRRGVVASNGPLHDFVIKTLALHVPKADR